MKVSLQRKFMKKTPKIGNVDKEKYVNSEAGPWVGPASDIEGKNCFKGR